VYVLRDQGCVCALDFRVREYCGAATVHALGHGRGAEGVLGFSGRADDRGPAGARGPGRLTLRDRRAPYYNVTMNGHVHRTAGPGGRPRPAGGPILGRATEAEICERRGIRSLESEKICRENMSRKYAARAGAVPDGAALAPRGSARSGTHRGSPGPS
jgi:hypothetical protein